MSTSPRNPRTRTAAIELPPQARISYRGEAREFKESSSAIYFTFGVALLTVFLVLAAQYESWSLPLAVMHCTSGWMAKDPLYPPRGLKL